ncbi:MAG: helix-turn-helix transcriptional regulator [Candidatus Aminicenantes bacterium]|nr:helix-turn-helix transcriptional regulator [Candidatus Aminicenantes bacterium]
MIKDYLSEIGSRIKKVRITLDFTQGQIAEKTGLSAGFLSQIEKGQKRPSSIYLFFLLVEHKININWLFSGKGEMFLTENLVEKSRGFNFGEDREVLEKLFHRLEEDTALKDSFISFFTRMMP